ncbi:uncharacterized protein LOC116298944 isoform X3 [Actinia tenebrosa]|nr:uncharacterized protein LOC116298944 isoform X3 [Actinia tenebrosa]
MVLCLLKLTFCKSIGDVFEKEALDEAIESTSAENPIQQHLSKRYEEASQGIRNKCYSGSLEETAEALGVLNLPGVRLVRVEGELYQKLLKNETIVERKSGSNESASKASRESSSAKRSSESIDMCEEEYAYTYILAHANGQLAYQVDTVVCQGEYCQSPYLNYVVGDFGDCVLKEQTMVVYIINAYGSFVPQTIKIGCACECMAYA